MRVADQETALRRRLGRRRRRNKRWRKLCHRKPLNRRVAGVYSWYASARVASGHVLTKSGFLPFSGTGDFFANAAHGRARGSRRSMEDGGGDGGLGHGPM